MTGLQKKINERNGESLAEVLIAVLIIAVGLVLLSTLVVASSRMVNNSGKKMSSTYAAMNALTSGTVEANNDYFISLKNGTEQISIVYYKKDNPSEKQSVSINVNTVTSNLYKSETESKNNVDPIVSLTKYERIK